MTSRALRIGAITARHRNVLVVVLLVVGVLLRGWDLGGSDLFRDEAESAINALTILEHGVPTDRYLDLPIFENTLTRPWPGNREYEFRDTSYFDRGLAVYHGWLPLYAMAASFASFGVFPDGVTERPRVQHSAGEMRRRTVAARAPSIVFAGVFLVGLFLVGRELYGEHAGLLAMAIGTFTPYLIDVARDARYYSATLAIGTFCMLAVWRVFRRGSWPDVLMAAGLFVTLFHTHLTTFAVLAFMFGALSLPVLRQPRGGAKVLALATIVAAGVLPWVLFSGFLDAARSAPMSYAYLRFPHDLWFYAGQHPKMGLLVLGAIAQLGVVLWSKKKLPSRITEPFELGRTQIVFLIGLLCLSNLAFLFLTPAANFFIGRMTLLLLPGAVVLVAVLLVANARILSPRDPGVVLTLIVVVGVAASWQAWLPRASTAESHLADLIGYLEGQNLDRETRVYALPYDHLSLTFYTGLPVQSVAPVRKSFFDAYEGDILILDRVPTPISNAWTDLNLAIFRGY